MHTLLVLPTRRATRAALVMLATLLCVLPPWTQAGESERKLLTAFDKAFSASDPGARAEALNALGDQTRALPDRGTSKPVAKAIARGLEDDDLDVRQAAVMQLSYGREVATTIAGLDSFLEEGLQELERSLGRDDKETRDVLSRGTVLFQNGCRALETYRDDRSVPALVSLFVPRGAGPRRASGEARRSAKTARERSTILHRPRRADEPERLFQG